ncbi:alcohol dehydrogenase catalytic domain-containing protein [uncultured Methanobrevibacter sp.]|uniref:alcohol dehydrogenase catalytic domain-containing protein n=1 Tax=uncultured Methanobrevibacter sp. TaxID=253161 RepID=UPI0025DD60A4|nr:zinc-binding dehydrogenase [uncultured Methanobrevibacter sp.]
MINIVYRLVAPKLLEEVYTDLDLEKGVIVRPTYLSICKADQRYYFGKRAPEVIEQKLPMALIHESIGTVVKDNTGTYNVGDNVVMIPNLPMKADDFIGENYRQSSKFRSSGSDGFMEEYVSLTADRLVRIPDEINLEVASFIELISVSVHAISRFLKLSHKRKNTIAVWGDGSFGYITALCLKIMFPESEIIVVGMHEEKLSMFTFADRTFLASELPEDISIDHAFECVGSSSANDAIDQIIETINPEGTVSLLGVSEFNISVNTRKILEKGLRIFGTNRSTREDFKTVIDLLEENEDMVHYLESLITQVIEINTLDDINHAFESDKNLRFGKTIMKWEI